VLQIHLLSIRYQILCSASGFRGTEEETAAVRTRARERSVVKREKDSPVLGNLALSSYCAVGPVQVEEASKNWSNLLYCVTNYKLSDNN
jgi:hypothetical protein